MSERGEGSRHRPRGEVATRRECCQLRQWAAPVKIAPDMRDREVRRAEPSSRPATAVHGAMADARVRGALQLQRTVGNRAATALLQRQEDDDSPLTDAQVTKALAF